MERAKYTRILSLDGGGIRGIIPGQILVALEKKLIKKKGPKARLAEYFDLVAGTSTGGILAVGILCPDNSGTPKYTAEELLDIYLERGDDIFDVSLWEKITSLGGMSEEKYSAKELEKALEDYFGKTELKDLIRPCLITAYDIKIRSAFFFRKHRADDPRYNFFVKDVARATSAAPTFFEPARIKSFSKVYFPLVDGGVFANNPALCAYAEARSMFERKSSARDMIILSIGTGEIKKSYLYKDAKGWGLLGWAKPVLDIMMSGVSETIDYQLKQIFDSEECADQYLRIQTEIPSWCSPEMDNATQKNIDALRELGEDIATKHDKELDNFVELLFEEE